MPVNKGFKVPLCRKKPYQNEYKNASQKHLYITTNPRIPFYNRVILHPILGQWGANFSIFIL